VAELRTRRLSADGYNVGEAGAIAALDDLYANNNEGLQRLADS